MAHSDRRSLWNALHSDGNLSARFLSGVSGTRRFADLGAGSCLSGAEELGGRSILVATQDQFVTALALLELDGIARRLILCPAGFPAEHIPYVAASAPVDAVVSDGAVAGVHAVLGPCIPCGAEIHETRFDRTPRFATEWILLTSGTTGRPKLVAHTLESLAGAIEGHANPESPVVWSTFYDIRRYGGLQIFLRAVLTGGSLVLSGPGEPIPDFLARAGAAGITHISGTPSHWRQALMSPTARTIDPQYVRLSGEIVDQAILDHLRAVYPKARIAHAFASTEAGVAFDVRDGMAGFPAAFIENGCGDVQMKVVDGSLRIRSTRVADRYAGQPDGRIVDAGGFVDTGDMLELRGDRYYFVGRRDGVINVGGLKVHPEEVETVINRHPLVRMSLVRTRKNPITGALVVADVVLKNGPANGHAAALERE
ncbi:MAG TPA: AMP-binding protein, partial [Terriglobales bacterium]|nr:AMP-binding protein [Terriglobales bacterium]